MTRVHTMFNMGWNWKGYTISEPLHSINKSITVWQSPQVITSVSAVQSYTTENKGVGKINISIQTKSGHINSWHYVCNSSLQEDSWHKTFQENNRVFLRARSNRSSSSVETWHETSKDQSFFPQYFFPASTAHLKMLQVNWQKFQTIHGDVSNPSLSLPFLISHNLAEKHSV